MMLALYVIGSTFALLLLSARLREAHDELARVREECDDRTQAVRQEFSAYAHGSAMLLACLLAGLAAAWYAPRPDSGRAGNEGAPTDGPGGRNAR
jgi:hypothetical protein